MRNLFVLASALLPLAAAAADAALPGVWKGSLGNNTVIVCINPETASTGGASFYLERDRQPIQLTGSLQARQWTQAGEGGTWSLDPPSGNKVSGTWRDARGERSTPIQLALVKPAQARAPCASDEYNADLEAFPGLDVSDVLEFDKKKYVRMRIADVVTVELIEPAPALKVVNRQLLSMLPRGKEDLNGYFARRREALARNGLDAQDETHADVTYWSTDFVTVKYQRTPAGGKRGPVTDWRTWDLHGGQEVDPWDWFTVRANGRLSTKFKRFLFQDLPVEMACVDHYRGEGEFMLSLETYGVRFWEDPVGGDCAKSVPLPFEALGQWLTPAGRLAIKRLQEHAPPKPQAAQE